MVPTFQVVSVILKEEAGNKVKQGKVSSILKEKSTLLILCGFLFFVVTGCGARSPEFGQAVSGEVWVGDHLLPAGQIVFKPVGDTKGPKASARVTNGRFMIPAKQGPWPGEFQVQISTISPDIVAFQSGASHDEVLEAAKQRPLEIADEFNTESKLRWIVQEKNENRCEFRVQWATSRR